MWRGSKRFITIFQFLLPLLFFSSFCKIIFVKIQRKILRHLVIEYKVERERLKLGFSEGKSMIKVEISH